MSKAYKCDRCESYNDGNNVTVNAVLPGVFTDAFDENKTPFWAFWRNEQESWFCKGCTKELVEVVNKWFNQ